MVENIFALGAWKGWLYQAGQVGFEFAAMNDARHFGSSD
jgi:hypothetical protein